MSLSRIKEWLDGEILEADDLNIEFNNIINNAIVDIVEDTTPQLGAHLDMNDFGLSFPATQAPDAGANVLDDYEEGTWTPALTFGGNSVGITYSHQLGGYTKIGRTVTLTGYIALSNKGSSTGETIITGLPFAVKSGNNYHSPCTFRHNGISFADMLVGYVPQNSSHITLGEVTNAGSYSPTTEGNWINTSSIIIGTTYHT